MRKHIWLMIWLQWIAGGNSVLNPLSPLNQNIATTITGHSPKIEYNTSSFDWLLANTTVWLSALAYCDAASYMTHNFTGSIVDGFVPYAVIDTKARDVQGFTGYLPSQDIIYVVFRGSTSRIDWIGNIDTILTKYNKCDNCKVHLGFHRDEDSIKDEVLHMVFTMKQQYKSANIVTTGHSLGAAVATLLSLDLLELNLGPIWMYNYGSPRIGNTYFAEYASNQLAVHNRVTHNRDIVPHLPSDRRFTHISGEWYEDKEGVVHPCEGFEDSNCSNQWFFWSIEDHMHYLGVDMDCKYVS